MNEIICYTHLLPTGQTKELTFWDILLDDRWTEGDFSCSESVYHEIGNINPKLHAKQNYEFILRAAEKFPITAVGQEFLPQSDDAWEAFQTDCYIVGKYSHKLQEHGYFNPIVSSLLNQASHMSWKEKGVAFLESMISHTPAYYEIDDNTRPILLYRDTEECCNVLNLFTDFLASALQQCHQRVEIFDAQLEDTHALTKYIGQHFKAIIGIQTYFFAIMMQDGVTNLHDLIIGPKYNMILDHPAWLKDEIQRAPQNYYLLLHDRNYIYFSMQHYPKLAGCIHFPPAGFYPDNNAIPMASRKYDITFIGTYRDYRERLSLIRKYNRRHRLLAAKYLQIMKKHPDYPAEEAFQKALQHYHLGYNDKQFLQLFYDMRQVNFCIMLYYREKVIQTLLDAGIKIDVFSTTWEKSPFANHPCLTCHPEIDPIQSLTVMQNSRISLNIMSWHKDGLTERIFNSMLCQSVVLSDETTGLAEYFVNQEDLVLFSLTELSSLPTKVKTLLADNALLQQIATNGYQKAQRNHSWLSRAQQLLQILDK